MFGEDSSFGIPTAAIDRPRGMGPALRRDDIVGVVRAVASNEPVRANANPALARLASPASAGSSARAWLDRRLAPRLAARPRRTLPARQPSAAQAEAAAPRPAAPGPAASWGRPGWGRPSAAAPCGWPHAGS